MANTEIILPLDLNCFNGQFELYPKLERDQSYKVFYILYLRKIDGFLMILNYKVWL